MTENETSPELMQLDGQKNFVSALKAEMDKEFTELSEEEKMQLMWDMQKQMTWNKQFKKKVSSTKGRFPSNLTPKKKKRKK
jgi:hypothetical protein